MVFLPSFQGIDQSAVHAIEELHATAEKRRQAVKAVQQFPIEDLRAAQTMMRKNLQELRPALRQMQEINEVLRAYHNQVEAVKELAQQMQGVREMLREVQSVVEAVQQVRPRQWAALAGLTGISVSVTAPLWMSVPGIAPPISQLPTVALTDIAVVLAGEAGYAASVAVDIAIHYVEIATEDEFYREVAIFLIAGLIAWGTNVDPTLRDVKNVKFWLPLVLTFVMKFLLPNNE